ncbi:hypothetical protein PAPHI01_1246 [Pancytospora philotis]|nr:hypothetical protein PAPHI01_1246 [Pancytospora philotis]
MVLAMIEKFLSLDCKCMQILFIVLGICVVIGLFKAICMVRCKSSKKKRDVKKIIERRMGNQKKRN